MIGLLLIILAAVFAGTQQWNAFWTVIIILAIVYFLAWLSND